MSCWRSMMMYGTETQAVKEEGLYKFIRAEASMVKWMCIIRQSGVIALSE